MDQEESNLYNNILQTLVLLLTMFTSYMQAKKITGHNKKQAEKEATRRRLKNQKKILRENFDTFSKTFDFLVTNNEELKNKTSITSANLDLLLRHLNVSSSGSDLQSQE